MTVPSGDRQQAAAPSSLGIVALVLAVLVPVAGLVVGLVGRSAARREGRRADTVTTAAVVVGAVLSGVGVVTGIGLLVVALVVGQQVTAVTRPDRGPDAAAVAPRAGIVTTVSTASGGPVPPAVTEGTVPLLRERLRRAGIEPTSVETSGDGRYTVALADDTTAGQARRAGRVVTAAVPGGIFPVVLVEDVPSGTVSAGSSPLVTQDLADELSSVTCRRTLTSAVTVGQGLVVVCSPDLRTKYVLGAVIVQGTDVAETSADESGVRLRLDADGTSAFASFSTAAVAAAQPLDQQMAVVSGNEVLVAPMVQAAVTNGVVQLSGVDGDEHVAAALAFAAADARFTLDAVTPGR